MPKNKEKKVLNIGVFDSGLGGLSVLKYLLRIMPEHNYIYLGDTARLPYGGRSAKLIYEYSKEALDFLFSKDCDLIVVACNTVSALALDRLKKEYLKKKYPKKEIFGVIEPLVELSITKKKIAVIGTKATIKSETYKNRIQELNPKLEVFSQSAPLLVPLIEEGFSKNVVTKKILKRYLRPLKSSAPDILILACTHYPFLLKEFRRQMGKNCLVPDPGEVVAVDIKNRVEKLIKTQALKFNQDKKLKASCHFYLSDDPSDFLKIAERFLGEKINDWNLISL